MEDGEIPFVFPAQPGEGTHTHVNSLAFWKELAQQVDWKEPWILILVGFHIVSTLIICTTRQVQNFQIFFGLALGGLVLSAERINELAALHWQEFSTQQYFDSHGIFISIVLSLPILLNLLLMTVIWLYDAAQLLVVVKKKQLKAKIKASKGDLQTDQTPGTISDGKPKTE